MVRWAGEVADVLNNLHLVGGPGIETRETPGGITISATAQADDVIWAQITGLSYVGTVKQSVYAWTEVEKIGTGYGNWQPKTNGRTGTAYNGIENQPNYIPAPVLEGTIVAIRDYVTVDGIREYWFDGAAFLFPTITAVQLNPTNSNQVIVTAMTDTGPVESTFNLSTPPTYKDLDVVTDVNWDGTNLNQVKTTISITSYDEDGDTSIIDTPETCTS
jgi:hypothetical protein